MKNNIHSSGEYFNTAPPTPSYPEQEATIKHCRHCDQATLSIKNNNLDHLIVFKIISPAKFMCSLQGVCWSLREVRRGSTHQRATSAKSLYSARWWTETFTSSYQSNPSPHFSSVRLRRSFRRSQSSRDIDASPIQWEHDITGSGVKGHHSGVLVWHPGCGCGPVWGNVMRFWTGQSWLRCRWSVVCLWKTVNLETFINCTSRSHDQVIKLTMWSVVLVTLTCVLSNGLTSAHTKNVPETQSESTFWPYSSVDALLSRVTLDDLRLQRCPQCNEPMFETFIKILIYDKTGPKAAWKSPNNRNRLHSFLHSTPPG